jgi:predicted TIM-barrel fold metal-dependent hydrolase
VLIHSADPKPFWDPMDANNERWLELKTRPGRKRSDTDPAPWQTIMDEQHNVFRRHPRTIFINAHLGWYGNNLQKLGELMDAFPNMYTEIGAVIAELGRQPRFARAFLIKYQDRVMFGKDSWVPEEYSTYFRVLETADDYFPYHKRYHAFWRMYGLDLPDEVLKKIYYKNALKVIPNIDASLFPK